MKTYHATLAAKERRRLLRVAAGAVKDIERVQGWHADAAFGARRVYEALLNAGKPT